MRILHTFLSTIWWQNDVRILRRANPAAIVFLIVCGGTVSPAMAQSYTEAIGVPAFTQALPVEKGFINAANGNLHLEIPLGSFPQRGGGKEDVMLEYDSSIWSKSCPYFCGWMPDNNTVIPNNGYILGGSWTLVTSIDPGTPSGTEEEYGECDPPDNGEPFEYEDIYTWGYTDASGKGHNFSTVSTTYVVDPTDCPGTAVPSSGGYADDGSGYYISVTNYTDATVYMPDGAAIFVPGFQSVEAAYTDPNGNQYTRGWSLDSYYHTISTFYDTLNRTVAEVSESSDLSKFYIAVPNAQGGTSTYTAHLSTVNVDTNFGLSGYYEYSGSFEAITELDLPDGTEYTFGYDSGTSAGHYGEMIGMALPTGGSISYAYANFIDATGSTYRWVSQRTTPDSTTPWTYTPNFTSCSVHTYCQQTLTATKPSGDHSVYTFTFSTDINSPSVNPWLTLQQDYDSSANLMASTSACYNFVTLSSGTCSYSGTNPGFSSVLFKTSETTTLPVPGGSVSKTTVYSWDSSNNGNMTQMAEWNFGSSPSTSADRTTAYTYYSSGYVIDKPATITVTNSSGSLVSKTVNSYDGSTLVTSGATGIAQHDDTDYGSTFTARGNPTQVQRYTSSSSYVTSSMTYDITGQMRTATDPNGNVTHYSYADSFFTDSGDNRTPSTYTPSTATNAYLTSETDAYGASVAETKAYGHYWGTGQMALSTDPNSQTTYYNFYNSLSLPTSTIFPDLGWNFSAYSGSETEVDVGIGITSTTLSTTCSTSGSACRHDETLLDSLGRTSSQILVSDPGGPDTVTTTYDGDGRVYSVSNPQRSASSTTDGTETYLYDGLDRRYKTTRADGTGAYLYYGAAVSSYGGRSSQMCSGYGVGYPELSVDEAAKLRQSWTDGFGRLIEVDEPDPSSGSLTSGSPANTCYGYDLNNNLTAVSQASSRSRSFTYDMASRLVCSANPELYAATCPSSPGSYTSGTVAYSYDSNGNVTSKQAPKENQTTASTTVTTTSTYDALNRLTQKSYNDSTTPTVKYFYDGASPSGCSVGSFSYGSYAVSHRTAMCDAAGSEAWSYDKMGRVATDQRTSNSVTLTTTYATTSVPYNYDGSIAQQAYPSGRTITNTWNSAQQLVSAVDTTHSLNFATSAGYAPPGELQSITNGSSLASTFLYNDRLQPCWTYSTTSTALAISTMCTATDSTPGNIFDLKYNFSPGSGDNGNVMGITNNVSGYGGRSQAFTYDYLNRLYTAETTGTYSTSPSYCWGEQYTIDTWGNLYQINSAGSPYTGCTGESLSLSATTQNHLSTGTTPNYGYDVAGNMTYDISHNYTFDAENQILQVDGTPGTCSTATECYVYDGDGHRLEKATSSASKLYWYDTSGNVLDETDGSGSTSNSSFNEYVFFNGSRIARLDSSSNVFYYFADHLGSSRAITNSSGTVCYDADYYPYGGQRSPVTNSCTWTNNYKFTGKERDSESNLDDFLARYYTSSLGRFMSPDWSDDPEAIPYADPGNPQSLNLYAYVRNNPLTDTDPDGHRLDCDDGTVSDVDGVFELHYECHFVKDDPPPLISNFEQFAWDVANFALKASVASVALPAEALVKGLGMLGPAPKPGCVGGMALAGASGGAEAGLAGGPGAELTIPTFSAAGGVLGGAAGLISCSKGTGGRSGTSGGGDNQRANKSANDAKREAERKTGKNLSLGQEEKFHDLIKGQHYTYDEMVEVAVEILEGRSI